MIRWHTPTDRAGRERESWSWSWISEMSTTRAGGPSPHHTSHCDFCSQQIATSTYRAMRSSLAGHYTTQWYTIPFREMCSHRGPGFFSNVYQTSDSPDCLHSPPRSHIAGVVATPLTFFKIELMCLGSENLTTQTRSLLPERDVGDQVGGAH